MPRAYQPIASDMESATSPMVLRGLPTTLLTQRVCRAAADYKSHAHAHVEIFLIHFSAILSRFGFAFPAYIFVCIAIMCIKCVD